MPSVLISSVSEDEPAAALLAKQVDVFGLDVGLHRPGGASALRPQMEEADAFIALWSGIALQSSAFDEAALLADAHKKLLNARLDATAVPLSLSNQECLDISGWLDSRSPLQIEDLRLSLHDLVDETRYARALADAKRPDIYLAYTHADMAAAQFIAEVVERAGYGIWWDRDIPIGSDWMEQLRSSFNDARCVLWLATQRSIKSSWMLGYLRQAVARGVLLPVLLEPIHLEDAPLGLRTVQLLDMAGTEGEARLLQAIHRQIGPPPLRILLPKPVKRRQPKTIQRTGYDTFVSYKSEERERVRPYVQQLGSSGLKVWWDEMIPQGANYGREIDNALKASRSVVVFWSPLAIDSDEVYAEAEYGNRIRSLFQAVLEPCDIPERMKVRQYVELFEKQEHSNPFGRLIASLKDRIAAV